MTTTLGNITLHNADCMEMLKSFSDNQFDLAIVDPPFGDAKLPPPTQQLTNQQVTSKDSVGGSTDTNARWSRFGGRFDRYKRITPPHNIVINNELTELTEQSVVAERSMAKKL